MTNSHINIYYTENECLNRTLNKLELLISKNAVSWKHVFSPHPRAEVCKHGYKLIRQKTFSVSEL